MSTIFTKVINGEIPVHKVWEDDAHLAFLDIRPMTDGHTLVIPKREVNHIFDLSAEETAAIWMAARKVGRRLKDKLGCARVCIGTWGYEVPHAHIHLIPTNSMTDFPPPPGNENADSDALAALADELSF